MVNYGNGKIYELVNDVDDKIYVGSTTRAVSKRKGDHKALSTIYPNRKIYKHLNSIGWKHDSIVLVEKYPCKDKEELIKREHYYFKQLGASLNTNVPGRTMKQYCEDNKDKIPERKKQYRQENKDKIRERKKQYRQENKDKIRERQKQIILCECGCNISRSHMNRHTRTNKHKRIMK